MFGLVIVAAPGVPRHLGRFDVCQVTLCPCGCGRGAWKTVRRLGGAV